MQISLERGLWRWASLGRDIDYDIVADMVISRKNGRSYDFEATESSINQSDEVNLSKKVHKFEISTVGQHLLEELPKISKLLFHPMKM